MDSLIQRLDLVQTILTYESRGPAGEYLGSPANIRRPTAAVLWLLKVGSYTGDDFDSTLQVKLQTRVHDVWFSVALSDGFGFGSINKQVVFKLSATEPMASVVNGGSDFGDGMVGGNIRHIIGEEWRVAWKIEGANPATAFTFGSWLVPIG